MWHNRDKYSTDTLFYPPSRIVIGSRISVLLPEKLNPAPDQERGHTQSRKTRGKLYSRWAHHCQCWRRAQVGCRTGGSFWWSSRDWWWSLNCSSLIISVVGSNSVVVQCREVAIPTGLFGQKIARTIAICTTMRIPNTHRIMPKHVKRNVGDGGRGYTQSLTSRAWQCWYSPVSDEHVHL